MQATRFERLKLLKQDVKQKEQAIKQAEQDFQLARTEYHAAILEHAATTYPRIWVIFNKTAVRLVAYCLTYDQVREYVDNYPLYSTFPKKWQSDDNRISWEVLHIETAKLPTKWWHSPEKLEETLNV